MRKVFLLVAVFAMMLPSMMSAADKDSGEVIAKEFILEDFDGLKAGNRFDVELEHSSWYSVTVTLPAELEAYLDVKVENGNLVLGLNNTSQKIISLFKGKGLRQEFRNYSRLASGPRWRGLHLYRRDLGRLDRCR